MYWNCLRSTNGDEPRALAKVRQKYFDEFAKKDLHFFLGTTQQFHFVALNPWVIIGLLPTPAEKQLGLFSGYSAEFKKRAVAVVLGPRARRRTASTTGQTCDWFAPSRSVRLCQTHAASAAAGASVNAAGSATRPALGTRSTAVWLITVDRTTGFLKATRLGATACGTDIVEGRRSTSPRPIGESAAHRRSASTIGRRNTVLTAPRGRLAGGSAGGIGATQWRQPRTPITREGKTLSAAGRCSSATSTWATVAVSLARGKTTRRRQTRGAAGSHIVRTASGAATTAYGHTSACIGKAGGALTTLRVARAQRTATTRDAATNVAALCRAHHHRRRRWAPTANDGSQPERAHHRGSNEYSAIGYTV
jgi:hypothetical protein